MNASAAPAQDDAASLGRTARLNWLRAGVLGANDGIVSIAGLVLGVAGATTDRGAIFTAGMAGLVAGALSMGLGEYISVSSQRDSERALLVREQAELSADPAGELDELAGIYEAKGLSPSTARLVAEELSAKDALGAHLDAELHLDPDDIVNPWHAVIASIASFVLGGALPLLAMLLPPANARVPVTFFGMLIALAITGAVSATVGESSRRKAITRVVIGGALGLAATYGIGHLFGAAVS